MAANIFFFGLALVIALPFIRLAWALLKLVGSVAALGSVCLAGAIAFIFRGFAILFGAARDKARAARAAKDSEPIEVSATPTRGGVPAGLPEIPVLR